MSVELLTRDAALLQAPPALDVHETLPEEIDTPLERNPRPGMMMPLDYHRAAFYEVHQRQLHAQLEEVRTSLLRSMERRAGLTSAANLQWQAAMGDLQGQALPRVPLDLFGDMRPRSHSSTLPPVWPECSFPAVAPVPVQVSLATDPGMRPLTATLDRSVSSNDAILDHLFLMALPVSICHI
jgi:hypothetical protein